MDADYTLPALDVALNLRSDRTVADLLARLSSLDEDLLSGVLAAHASGIKVLLAPPPSDDGSHPVSLPQVQQILAVLKRMFPWVIVDLGLPLNETAYAFLDEADRILVSVVPDMVALRNTRRMLDQLHSRGYPEDKVWLLLNRATIRGGVRKKDIEERLRMNAKLTHLVPDDRSLVTLSINRGIPLVVSHGRSVVGRAIDQLAQGLIDDLPGPENEPITEAKGKGTMKNRHIISLVLFVVAVVLLIAVGLVTTKWLFAVLLGLVFVLAGLFFYRRGK
jgi:pilus assembly protein CpaE